MLFLAATLYGVGKTFFWPTTLGVVSEQYPRGGALLLNAIAGVGMIAVGTIGGPAIGTLQDKDFNRAVQGSCAGVHAELARPSRACSRNTSTSTRRRSLTAEVDPEQAKQLKQLESTTKQHALTQDRRSARHHVPVLPGIDRLFPLSRRLPGRSAHRPRRRDEKFTGGVKGPVEA